VLHLIKMWLECPVEETDDRGRKKRTTEARDKRRGIWQICSCTMLLTRGLIALYPACGFAVMPMMVRHDGAKRR
jgi:hypothetical protein